MDVKQIRFAQYCIEKGKNSFDVLIDNTPLTDDFNKKYRNMENEEFVADQFIVKLKIEGTSYEEVEVEVTDPNKSIRDQIDSIVKVFNLAKLDGGGNPIQYLLGLDRADDELEILQFNDEDGREMTLEDYNVQPGDFLHLISQPIAG